MKEQGTIFDAKYPIVEMFYSLQGEGVYSGRAAFFIRLAGCNVCCPWCDSKNSWDVKKWPLITVKDIIESVKQYGANIVVITGGEPMTHDLNPITQALKQIGVRIHVETSGSENFSGEFDWITLSPKKRKKPLDVFFDKANELKIVIEEINDFNIAEEYASKVNKMCALLLQCQWTEREKMMSHIVEYIKKNNKWGLSQQTHKYIGVE